MRSYLDQNQFLKVLSRSTFYKYVCPYVINPSIASCVDIIKSTLLQLSPAPITSWKHWQTYRNNSVKKTIYASCCVKVAHPQLIYNKKVPTFLKWACTKGTCSSYGTSSLRILDCPVLNSCNIETKCNEWYLVKEILAKFICHMKINVLHEAELR